MKPQNKNFKLKNRKSGQAAIIAVVLMLIIMISAVFGASAVALKESKTALEDSRARFSFFAAEAGVDDAAYRLKRGKNLTSSFTISLNGAAATTTVTTLGAVKSVKSSGSASGDQRAVAAILTSGTGVSFHYGLQVGNGGFSIGNGSIINGNVFSNSGISGNGPSQSRISGNAQVSDGNSANGVRINSGATAGSFNNCIVDGLAQYVTSFSNCTASSTQTISGGLSPQPFPISQSQITSWENDAVAGGTLSSYSINNNSSGSLGPKKVSGNVTLGNGATWTLTGTVWVSGTISFGNNDVITLSPAIYGASSGILIVDNNINIGNGVTLSGTGQAGSYLMLIVNDTGDAIDIGNNATGTILYAPNGKIEVSNNLTLKELTAYKIEIGNNSSVTYESGLANINFVSGPSGGWNISSWGEVVP